MSEETEKLSQPPKRGPKGARKHKELMKAIITNEAYKGTPQYLTPAELASQFQVVSQIVYTYRNRLGMRGVIERNDGGQRGTKKYKLPTFDKGTNVQHLNERKPHKSWAESRSPISTEDLLQSLKDEGVIGPLDRLKVLSRLVRTGSPLIKINAIKALEDLSKQSEGRVGPPTPKTEEEGVARLARLLLAIGENIAQKAFNVAFQPQEEGLSAGEPPPQVPNDPGDLPSPVREPGGVLLDMPGATADSSD